VFPPDTAAGGPTRNRYHAAKPSAGRRHPLLNAFPLTVMTLATFLVLFTLMMARLQAGADPALRASAPGALVAGRPGSAAITTRASGSAGASATPAAVTAGSVAATPVVITRTSGVPGRSGAGDD
jgi:hypothetical protein